MAAPLPLQGIRVVNFGWVWAGPVVGQTLAFLGAEVLKIESRARIDMTRNLPPFAEGIVDPNRSLSNNACWACRQPRSKACRRSAPSEHGNRITAMTNTLPLKGIRVINFGWVWAGPVVGQTLGFLGAEVLKIESRARIDMTRNLPPFAEGIPGPDRSLSNHACWAGNGSVTLDLKHAEGLELALRLIAESDVVIENFGPGVMERLGIGYESLRAVKPDIILFSMPAAGLYGPLEHVRTYGLSLTSLTGLDSLVGYKGETPIPVENAYSDPFAGIFGSFAILSALTHRRNSGEGQHIDFSQQEAVMQMVGPAYMDYALNGRSGKPKGNQHPTAAAAPHGVFPCSGDDRWIAIAIGSDAEWAALVAEMGAPAWATEPALAERAHEAWQRGAREVCMQGGIHPHYDGNTYLGLTRAVKAIAPDMHIHAFSPLEVLHGARTLGLSIDDYVLRLREAGLGTLPGTAAEILDDEVRALICADKLNTQEWLEVMRAAHRAGIRSTATIMFGHVDTPLHWARHLLHVRALQAETGGFTEFVPLPFVHMESPLWHKGLARSGPTLRESILMHAVARIVFGELIPNIQTSWVKMGREGAALCLRAGANDLGGTLMYESITRAAGGSHGGLMDDDDMRAIAASAGRPLRRRTTTYAYLSDDQPRAANPAPALLAS